MEGERWVWQGPDEEPATAEAVAGASELEALHHRGEAQQQICQPEVASRRRRHKPRRDAAQQARLKEQSGMMMRAVRYTAAVGH